jgi:hypothetical protein
MRTSLSRSGCPAGMNRAYGARTGVRDPTTDHRSHRRHAVLQLLRTTHPLMNRPTFAPKLHEEPSEVATTRVRHRGDRGPSTGRRAST